MGEKKINFVCTSNSILWPLFHSSLYCSKNYLLIARESLRSWRVRKFCSYVSCCCFVAVSKCIHASCKCCKWNPFYPLGLNFDFQTKGILETPAEQQIPKANIITKLPCCLISIIAYWMAMRDLQRSVLMSSILEAFTLNRLIACSCNIYYVGS